MEQAKLNKLMKAYEHQSHALRPPQMIKKKGSSVPRLRRNKMKLSELAKFPLNNETVKEQFDTEYLKEILEDEQEAENTKFNSTLSKY